MVLRPQGCIRTADNHRRRGGAPPPGTPTPVPGFHSGKKMKFTKGNIDSGYFWYTNIWVADPLPPSSILIHACPTLIPPAHCLHPHVRCALQCLKAADVVATAACDPLLEASGFIPKRQWPSEHKVLLLFTGYGILLHEAGGVVDRNKIAQNGDHGIMCDRAESQVCGALSLGGVGGAVGGGAVGGEGERWFGTI